MLKEMSVEIIRKCPNRCVHCSSMSDERCKEMLDYRKFRELVDAAKELGAETSCLSGGEPLLHPEVINMIFYVKNKGLNCYVYTSGIIFDDKLEKSCSKL